MGNDERLPKVSVIMTVYNQEGTLAASLDSALAQMTNFPFEIELADDCSTDSTPEICRRYAERYPGRIRLTLNAKNLGIPRNYFETLRRCRAPYIADLAGDDLWTDPHKLARQAAILDAEPDVTLVHTAWKYLHGDTGLTSPTPFTGNEPWLAPRIDGRTLIAPMLSVHNAMAVHSCTAMFRKDTFLKAYAEDSELFDTDEYRCEDLQLLSSLAYAGTVAYIPNVTLSYRVGSAGQITSTSDFRRAYRFNFGTLRLRLRLQLKYGIVSEAITSKIRTLCDYTVGLAFLGTDREALAEMRDFIRENRLKVSTPTRFKLFLGSHPTMLRAVRRLVGSKA